MAKTQKFPEELMVEAVIRYAEIHKGKIKLTELAEWASENMEGLEDVRSYMFMRPIMEKDKKTGTVTKRNRPCTDKINEINDARGIRKQLRSNPLLSNSNIDQFLELTRHEQRKLVMKAREDVRELIKNNAVLVREKSILQEENNRLQTLIKELDEKLMNLQGAYDRLETHIGVILQGTNETRRQEELTQMEELSPSQTVMDGFWGIKDGCAKAFMIKDEIKKTQKRSDDLFDEIMKGINLDE